MKSIYLFVSADPDQEAQLQVALDLTRAQSGHLTCLQVTPVTELLMATDPLLGTGIETIIQGLQEGHELLRGRMEERLRRESISWDWLQTHSEARWAAGHCTELADIVVIGRDTGLEGSKPPSGVLQDVVTNAVQPVLVVPPEIRSFRPEQAAIVAWNGSEQSARALRAAVPLLQKAEAVHIVTIEEKDTDFPATDASLYLSYHGIKSNIRWIERNAMDIGQTLINVCGELNAGYIVLGAYGRSRAGEWLFGGVTRHMLGHSPYPLLMAH